VSVAGAIVTAVLDLQGWCADCPVLHMAGLLAVERAACAIGAGSLITVYREPPRGGELLAKCHWRLTQPQILHSYVIR
jgi:hypothetical protein